MITSRNNPQVKQLVKLINKVSARRKEGVFFTEGVRMFKETPPEVRLAVYVSESFLSKEEHRLLLIGMEYQTVSDMVFRRMSQTQTPQGILCIVRMPSYRLAELMKQEKTHLLILEDIQDPGNLGTMFRTAEGAGATGIIMNRTCVDLFSPKTVRATMGSIYRMPFYVAEDLKETINEIKQQGVTIYAAHLKGRENYDAFDYQGGCAFMIGNEGAGLTEETAGQADAYLRIPMEGHLESLNAATAAGILMYEVNRQRRMLPGSSFVY